MKLANFKIFVNCKNLSVCLSVDNCLLPDLLWNRINRIFIALHFDIYVYHSITQCVLQWIFLIYYKHIAICQKLNVHIWIQSPLTLDGSCIIALCSIFFQSIWSTGHSLHIYTYIYIYIYIYICSYYVCIATTEHIYSSTGFVHITFKVIRIYIYMWLSLPSLWAQKLKHTLSIAKFN